MKKIILLIALMACANGQTFTMTPDGSYVAGDQWTITPDGQYVGGSEWTMAPDGTYLGVQEQEKRDSYQEQEYYSPFDEE